MAEHNAKGRATPWMSGESPSPASKKELQMKKFSQYLVSEGIIDKVKSMVDNLFNGYKLLGYTEKITTVYKEYKNPKDKWLNFEVVIKYDNKSNKITNIWFASGIPTNWTEEFQAKSVQEFDKKIKESKYWTSEQDIIKNILDDFKKYA